MGGLQYITIGMGYLKDVIKEIYEGSYHKKDKKMCIPKLCIFLYVIIDYRLIFQNKKQKIKFKRKLLIHKR